MILRKFESTDHAIMLFDSKQGVCQVNTLVKLGVIKEVRRTINLNDKICHTWNWVGSNEDVKLMLKSNIVRFSSYNWDWVDNEKV